MQKLLKTLHHLPVGSKLRIHGKPGPWRYLGDGYICKYTYDYCIYDDKTQRALYPPWEEVLGLIKRIDAMSPFSLHGDYEQSLQLYWKSLDPLDKYTEWNELCTLLCRDDTIRASRIKQTDGEWFYTRAEYDNYKPLTKIWIIT